MAGQHKTLCLLDSGKITPYHAAFTLDSRCEISDRFRFIGAGYILSSGARNIPYDSGVRYRFYIGCIPKRVRESKKLYRDLINELQNNVNREKRNKLR